MANEAVIEPGPEILHRLPPLKALTSLRFFAAIYVAVYHLASGHALVGNVLAENFIASGDTGVSLFFILSGFILAYNYGAYSYRQIDSLREFWASRFARIYPVYLFALLLGFAYSFAPASPPDAHRWLRFVLTAGLLQSWYQPFSDSFNGPGWTLSVEAFFYALFPFALRAIGRVGTRMFALLCVLYVALLCVPPAMLAAAPEAHAAALAALITGSRSPVLHLPLFLIGVWLGLRFSMQGSSPAALDSHETLPSRLTHYLASLACVALLCAGPSGVYEPARRGLLALCYAALIVGLATVRRGALVNPWMVLAGEISFSIYILQMPVLRTVFGLIRPMHVERHLQVALALAALVAASYLAYRFIELPARVAIRRRLTHKPVRLLES